MLEKILSVYVAAYLLGYVLDGLYSVTHPSEDAKDDDMQFNRVAFLLHVTLFIVFILVLVGVI